ncbi:MAG: hypothetical protein HZC17_04465 [Candidatus Omnitrophica bacterium]|nr:hypothetical protein [Candidatus Omnitrophota bacterium]
MIRTKFSVITLTGLILFVCLNSPIYAQKFEAISDSDTRDRFEEALTQSIERLHILIQKNPTRLRDINSSIKETIQAAELAGEGRNLAKALALCQSAEKKYSDNVLAYLIASDIYDSMGNVLQANQARLNFLKKSSRAPWIAREAMSWENREAFFDYVTGKLKRYGIETPKAATRIPLIEKMMWEKGNNLRDAISVTLPLIVFVGLALLLFRVMGGGDISIERKNRIVVQFYLLFVGLYLLWILHLFMNLAPIIDPAEMEIVIVFFAGIALIILLNLIGAMLERWRELSDPQAMECPHCRAIIAKIVAECPYCGKKVD